MTTLPINLPSAPIATPEAVALLESQEDVLQTAVSTTLRQRLFHNHGRLMTPRRLPTASQEIVQDYLYYLRHADLPHLTNTVNNLANQGLGHLSALAVTDTLSATSYTLLQEANLLTPEITPHLDEYRRHFLHKYMQAREHITITSREYFYQNVGAALGKQVGQERDLRHELEEQRSQLTQERALLNSLLDSIPDLIFYKDINSVYLGCNDAFAKFAGRAETDLIGKTDFDLFPHDVATFFREQDVEMMTQQQARQNEEWVDYPDGRRVLLDTLKTPFYDADNNLLGLIGISRDITASYESQAELLRLGYVIEQSLDGTAVANLDGIVEFVNPAWAAMHGYTPDELISQHLSIFHTPEQLAQEVAPVNQQAISSGQPQRAEIGHVRKDGSTFPTLMTIGLLKGSDGSPIGLVASVQDISEQKAATAALRENQARLAQANQVIESSPA
ncbi:MAG: PAS domain S-box protein, partial [Anaerolinea sp.]|nr:PAS domain S-box protein [Anaerolinea sp.]